MPDPSIVDPADPEVYFVEPVDPNQPQLKGPSLSEQYPDVPVVSFYQLLTWDRCQFQWWLMYNQRFGRYRKGYATELGTMGHAMLFDLYKTGQDNSADFANKWLEDWENLDAEQMSNIHIAVAQFKLYRELFMPVHDANLVTEALEYHFEVLLVTPQGRRFILQGYIDRMSRDREGRLWIEDYKWTQRFWSPTKILMHPQLTYYAGALRELGITVHGLLITQVNTYPYKEATRKKKTVDDLFKRERIFRNDQEIDNVMWEVGLMMDEMLEARERDAEGTQNGFRRSLRDDCEKCWYQEPCIMGIKGIDPIGFMYASDSFYKKEKRTKGDMQKGGIPDLQKPRPRIPDDFVVEEEAGTITIK